MIRISTADALLYRWRELHEQLTSPRGASGVLHSGLRYGAQCTRCECRQWVPKAIGRQLQRTYHPVCMRCGRDWPVAQTDLRVGEISCGRSSAQERRFDDLARAIDIIAHVPLWPRRVWSLHVLGDYSDVHASIRSSQRSTYEDLAQECARRWRRKHAAVEGGFFTRRHCRTLVATAREQVEHRARRARIWEGVAA